MSRKYIPPHLRNKQEAGGGSSSLGRAAASSPGGSSLSSLQRAASKKSPPANEEASRFSSNVRHDKFAKPEGSSRWSQVNREDIEKGSSATSRKHHTNHRSHNGSTSSLSYRTTQHPKILFFGDSFVRLFSLMKHSHVEVQGFKGASSKGLGREGNGNRATILQQIQKYRPERIVLNFGSVDVHLSYYFTKYTKEGPTIELVSVGEAYVEFVSTLKEYVAADKIHVIGVYPSPLLPDHVQESLVAYGVIDETTEISPEDTSIESRQLRVREFNAVLERCCAQHDLVFENPYDDVIDPATNLLKPCFRDVSSHNIHIVWETTVLLWMGRWPWFRALAKPDFEASLQKTLEEYVAGKPWAGEEHVATKVGVKGAFDLDHTET